uniref:Uncharacterized protein n=1 Tax=viral metagenome TaxID=1070528 RepID=A0A6C0E977_9ZZZZ
MIEKNACLVVIATIVIINIGLSSFATYVDTKVDYIDNKDKVRYYLSHILSIIGVIFILLAISNITDFSMYAILGAVINMFGSCLKMPLKWYKNKKINKKERRIRNFLTTGIGFNIAISIIALLLCQHLDNCSH